METEKFQDIIRQLTQNELTKLVLHNIDPDLSRDQITSLTEVLKINTSLTNSIFKSFIWTRYFLV